MYELIHAERANIPATRACRVLQVSRSGYYKWLHAKPSSRVTDDAALAAEVKEVFHEHRGRYGAPRIRRADLLASILKHHLLPVFGDMPLDAIKMHPIEVLKASLLAKGLSRKRVNNILACLGKMLRTRTKSNCSKSCRG